MKRIFRNHSLLFAAIATALAVVAVGRISGWFGPWLLLTAFFGIIVFARLFYGGGHVREAREARAIPVGTLDHDNLWRGGPSENELLVDAYKKQRAKEEAAQYEQAHLRDVISNPDDN